MGDRGGRERREGYLGEVCGRGEVLGGDGCEGGEEGEGKEELALHDGGLWRCNFESGCGGFVVEGEVLWRGRYFGGGGS